MQTENGKSICKLKMEKVIRKNKLELKIALFVKIDFQRMSLIFYKAKK